MRFQCSAGRLSAERTQNFTCGTELATIFPMDAEARVGERRHMVNSHLKARGIRNPHVLRAFSLVPREAFVPEAIVEHAYDDRPLPIGAGQTISQPYVVALTLEALALGDPSSHPRVLEIGTGSGYAAALLAHMAGDVHTVERIEELAEAAKERLEQLGLRNVHVHLSDGTLGWSEAAPYDAIAVAAGGPVVPQALIEQLAVGGTLVMPVTSPSGEGQILVRVRRTGDTSFEREDMDAVTFVPLIGAQGHDVDSEEPDVPRWAPAEPGTFRAASLIVREKAEAFDGESDERVVGELAERLSDARIVLLGESTHGTSEFYRLRGRITERLIERHGFDFVAAEADWPDAARIDDYVSGRARPAGSDAWRPFDRFPQWMWRNEEVVAFAERLREGNASRAREGRRPVGFHGLDLYSMYTSMSIVVSYLAAIDRVAADEARHRYATLMPWKHDPREYGYAVARGVMETAEEPVLATLRDLLSRRLSYGAQGTTRFFDAAQNARVVAAAEQYYRSLFTAPREGSRSVSWNLRDSHMFDTLRHLLAHYGGRSKAIVWAHNSHVGDARATEMRGQREHNLGQLCRQAFGSDVRLVGFGTDHGTVAAAHDWEAAMEVMDVRPSHPESYEHVFHLTGIPAFVLSLRECKGDALWDELVPARLLRAIGVVYRPHTELVSHYIESSLPQQYDEFVWFDETHALTPLAPLSQTRRLELPETYPFAL